MLGMTPLVSISERRLGFTMKSSMPRDSANWVLAISTSRRVRPICSRSSRNFLPAENTVFALPPGLISRHGNNLTGSINGEPSQYLKGPRQNNCPQTLRTLRLGRPLVREVRHEGLNLGLLRRCQRQQGEPRRTSVVSIKVQRIFDCWNSQFRHYFPGSSRKSFLFRPC